MGCCEGKIQEKRGFLSCHGPEPVYSFGSNCLQYFIVPESGSDSVRPPETASILPPVLTPSYLPGREFHGVVILYVEIRVHVKGGWNSEVIIESSS